MSESKNICGHCLLPLTPSSAIRDEINGREMFFCCDGCRGVYRLLNETGFQSFYDRRQGWTPGPPDAESADPALFKDSVAEKDGISEITLSVSGIRCASCIWLIEHFLMRKNGVEQVRVNYATHRAKIRWRTDEISLAEILSAMRAVGYSPRPWTGGGVEDELSREKRDLLIRLGTALFFSMQLMLYTVSLYAGYFQGMESFYKDAFLYIAWAFATPVMFYSGMPFITNSVRSIRNRTLNMDVLVFMGTFSAYAYSVVMVFQRGDVYFDTSATIITLILLGRYLELGARARAGEAISGLMALRPIEARLLRAGEEKAVSVPISSVKAGEIIEILPGGKIPLDGIVSEGESETDESMLTGESKPVKKLPGAEVFAGTLNHSGRLRVIVARIGGETVLSGIIRAVEDAQARRAPIQNTADRVVVWFVPLVLAISAGTLIFWKISGAGTSTALMNSVSVLVIACPCALGLATPLAVLVSSLSASKAGILIKGGDVLEAASSIDTVVLDKTGTLTLGRQSATDIIAVEEGFDVLSFAASIEAGSEHTIGKAMLLAYGGRLLMKAASVKAVSGKGISGNINGKAVLVGSPDFMAESGAKIPSSAISAHERLLSESKTSVMLSVDGKVKGVIGLTDSLRPGAKEAVAELKKRGIRTIMITGDNRAVAERIGGEAGITEIMAGITPTGKADSVRRLKAEGKKVLMAGDGINDAPALTEAHIGLAIGRATDIALSSADIVIMSGEMRLLAEALSLSKKTLRIIKENLLWAFSYNIIAIPLAVSGVLHPIVSAISMAASSLIVVGNSLRLQRRH